MKIAVIGYGDTTTPSTRFRFLDFQPFYAKATIDLLFIPRKKLREKSTWSQLQKVDLVVNQKCLLSYQESQKLRSLNVPIIFDFDDAIWTRPLKSFSWITQQKVNRRLKRALKTANHVTVANQHLADYAMKYSNNVSVIPMSLDEKWQPIDKQPSNKIRIGWNGSPGNLSYLEPIIPALETLQKEHPKVEIAIYCGKRPSMPFPFIYQDYNPAKEVRFIQQLDIGLLPLPDDEYSHGKSPIKSLQYQACGVTVAGNVSKGASEFLTEHSCQIISQGGDWLEAIEKLVTQEEKRKTLAAEGLQHFSKHHTQTVVFEQIRKVYKSCL